MGSRADYLREYRATKREKYRARNKQYHKDHAEEIHGRHARNRETNRETLATKRKAKVRRFKATLEIWKKAQGCTDCGTREGKLEYHHLDPKTKTRSISSMATCSLEALLDEIALCTVLCATCHRIRDIR